MKLTAEDRLEIQELLHRYMFILDAGEHHELGYGYADLYTEDGTFGTRPPGREALAAAAGRAADGTYSEVHQRGPQNQIHMNVGEIIVPTEDGAKGISYLLMIDGPANQIYWAGWYEDVYARTPKGWRFKSRVHVAGSRAGIPSNAAAIRREWQKLAMQHLTGDEAVATAAQPIARDPLNWVDSPE
ncbi:MAG: nuclear transport factor 2 family protein [Chloroflexi bacterium]|nr:nuclear transport factor 2 family protein [Chloroflexota bacterium]MBV9602558.1 nuclear transport factor 2 family protein [Chloroflexota bacterium]